MQPTNRSHDIDWLRIMAIVIAMFLISCNEAENIFKYPDYISMPDRIVESFGCGNIFVYQYLDSTQVLTVNLLGSEFNLTKECRTVDLQNANPNLSVILEVAGDDPDSVYFNFCNDIAYINMGTTTKYKAISGSLSYSVSDDNPIKDPIWESSYFVTIEIENLRLYNQESNEFIIIDKVTFWNVRVGWLPG